MDLTSLKNKAVINPDLVVVLTYIETLEARFQALEIVNGALIDMISLQRTRIDILEQRQHSSPSGERLLEACRIAARDL